MSSRIQSIAQAKYGHANSSEDRVNRRVEYDGYPSHPVYYSNHHHAHPEYHTSMPSSALRKSVSTAQSSPNRYPPLATTAQTSSFDSAITTTSGQSPRPTAQADSNVSASINIAARAIGRSSARVQPSTSQNMLSYKHPHSFPMELHLPPNGNTAYNDIHYHQYANPIQYNNRPDPYYPYHQRTTFSHYPFSQNWQHFPHSLQESSICHFPPTVVSSTSVLNSIPIAEVEYVTELCEHDVLSGRGGATNSYRGNRAFRTLVKDYQEEYLRAKKRDKPAVASLIVDNIRKRGGRFLRRDTNHNRRRLNRHDGSNGSGGYMIHWVDIGDDRAREKTCQALREGAPELRRQGHRFDRDDRGHGSRTSGRSLSFDDDHDDDTASLGKCSTSSEPKNVRMINFRHQRSIGRQPNQRTPMREKDHFIVDTHSDADDHTPEIRNGVSESYNHRRHSVDQINFSDEEEVPMFIRPWARLLPDRLPVEPIGLDQLSVQDRDMYLRDFVPPTARNELQIQHKFVSNDNSHTNCNTDDNDMNSYMHMYTNDDLYNSESDSKPAAINSNDCEVSQWSILAA
jgi:hypothetical protein